VLTEKSTPVPTNPNTGGDGDVEGIALNNISFSCRALDPNTYENEASASMSIYSAPFDI
jgi:hypothetical protein